jgi:hypothetical protein
MRVPLESWLAGDAVLVVLNVAVQVTVIVLLGMMLTRTFFRRNPAARHAASASSFSLQSMQ